MAQRRCLTLGPHCVGLRFRWPTVCASEAQARRKTYFQSGANTGAQPFVKRKVFVNSDVDRKPRPIGPNVVGSLCDGAAGEPAAVRQRLGAGRAMGHGVDAERLLWATLDLPPFRGHLMVLTQGVQSVQTTHPQAALSGAIS
jgi:hypothetical protein